MQRDTCLGLLYVDSTRGPDLARFGLWVVDAAAAILAPALARHAEREREKEREAMLRSVIVDALETVGAMDSALDLVADAITSTEDAARLHFVRDRYSALIGRAERLLELIRVDQPDVASSSKTFTMRALVASALEGLGESSVSRVELDAGAVRVRGDFDSLASALARVFESVAFSTEGAAVRVVQTAPHSQPEQGWRPGASAGKQFVRVEVEASDASANEEAELPLRAARRVVARNGGRLFVEPSSGGNRIVMEIETMEGQS
jgi:K+-sensing histidine kinase KdpD